MQFAKIAGVMGLLVVFLLINACSKQEEPQAKAEQQTAPVAQKGAAMDQPGATQTGMAAEQSGANGQEVYQGTCSSCHDTGVSGAPKLGVTSVWQSRIAAGKEQLVQSALNGKGAMPAKGGNTNLNETEVRAAVDYMIDQAR